MIKNINKIWICILVLLVSPAQADHSSVALDVGSTSAISTESAITLPAGKWGFGIRSEYQDLDSFSNAELKESADKDVAQKKNKHSSHSGDALWHNSIGIAYGVTDNFTAGIRLPYINRSNIKHNHPGGEILEFGDVEGVGDLSVFGQYRFYHNQDTHISAIFGFKAPTGKTNRRTDKYYNKKKRVIEDRPFELESQPGSGSWDGIIGGAFTQEIGPFTLSSSSLYTFVGTGKQQTDLGDIITYDAALSYRLMDYQIASFLPTGFAVDLITEVNGEWRDKAKINGHNSDDTGGNIVYISPGVKVKMAKNASLGFSLGIPVVKDTNGNQVEPDYRLITTGSIFW